MTSIAPTVREPSNVMRRLHLSQSGEQCVVLGIGDTAFHQSCAAHLQPFSEFDFQPCAWDESIHIAAAQGSAVCVQYSAADAFTFHIRRLVSARASRPIIVVIEDLNPDLVHRLFDLGVSDIIVQADFTPLHLRRVLSYAVLNHNHHQTRAFEARHHGIVENATEGIFQTTPQGQYLLANPALATLYGYDAPDALMHDLTNIAHQLYVDPDRRAEFATLMQANDAVRNFESRIRRKDGTIIWISENARAVRNGAGQLLYFEGFVRNISQRRDQEEKLRFLAQRDPLTGLPNRTLFKQRLEEAIARAKTGQHQCALLFIDLDNFKSINDTMGHMVGDTILKKVAHRLLACTDECDTVARLSGDEFVIILENIASRDAVLSLAERVISQLNLPHHVGQTDLYVSGSMGVSLYPDNARDSNEMIKNVDTAANHAKQQGRNTIKFYNAILSEQARRRLDVENGLRSALDHQELEVVYQPKINMKDGSVVGAEALLRWQSAELGPVYPDEFIPIAEETGLIVPIGAWVIETVCQQIQQWLEAGLNPGSIAVNIAAQQFKRGNVLKTIQTALETTGLDPKRLEIELTESALVTHISDTVNALTQLSALGVRTSVDDFGTGYSSLSYLKKFPISTLKIDRSFIMDIPHDGESAAIARAIVSLGHSLELSIVAEGIETEAQWHFLRALGCQFGQGYMFSRPIPRTEFEDMLRTAAQGQG